MWGELAQFAVVLLALYGAGELLLKLSPERPVPRDVVRRRLERGPRVIGGFDQVLSPRPEPEIQQLRDRGAL